LPSEADFARMPGATGLEAVISGHPGFIACQALSPGIDPAALDRGASDFYLTGA